MIMYARGDMPWAVSQNNQAKAIFKFTPTHPHDATHAILCLGAHSDDIEIGCGGALLRLHPKLSQSHGLLGDINANGRAEAEASAAAFIPARRRRNCGSITFKMASSLISAGKSKTLKA